MFSILIVDDEEPVLDSYEFMIHGFTEYGKEERPFALAGKARSGYEALKLIHETEPDLVFMDINIPGIDGLSVLEDVHKKYPRMVCVLSTAYERFDLARRAIPLGVFAYLVKPVSKKTFFSTLEDALAQLRSLPPESPEYDDPKPRLFRRDIWVPMDETRWEQYRKALNLPSDRALVMLVEMERDQTLWAGRIAEELSYRHHCTYDVILNRGLFLVSEDCNPAVFRQKTLAMLEELLHALSWYCGIGGLCRGPELYRSCSEALAELAKKRRETGVWDRERRNIARLRQKIGLVPPEEIKALFAALWEPLFAGDFRAAKIRMVSLFTLLLEDIFGVWSVENRNAENLDNGEVLPFDPAEIMELEDLGAWKRWAELNFDKLLLKANLERSGNYPLPLVKALAFIRGHYPEGVQLGDAAQAAMVSAAHLSRLFTEHLKTGFSDYLTELRIGEAERLLKEPGLTVKEIAYAVGYQDPNYFSKTFKRIKGILPTELR
ncbi:MAG: helix-turn-helix domain-containing protein [Treponema sp.]|nr:helix-turn-helix domain-containing protein [Treponema sp.]